MGIFFLLPNRTYVCKMNIKDCIGGFKMLSGYTLTEFEKKVEKLYKERNILIPSDLNIKNVAKQFNVEIDTSISGCPQRAIWDEEFSVIFLNPDLAEEKQREVFFHELGHPILHYGDQTKMKNKTFRELQEFQANQFQLYAAMPFFMIEQLELPKYEYQIVHLIKSVFNVTYSLAMKRFEQIKRRIFRSKIEQELIVWDRSVEEVRSIPHSAPTIEDLFSPSEIKYFKFNRLKTKRNKVYFDSYDGEMTPLWYVIEVDREEINWSQNLKFFPIDADFEIVPIKEYANKDSDAAIFKYEIKLHHSKPNDFGVDLKELKRKLNFYDIDPYNITRLVLSVQDLEEVLQLSLVSIRVKEKIKTANYL